LFLTAGIRVKSLANPHDDLPPGMAIFAQLIGDGKILKQTETSTPEASGNSWKLKFDYKMWVSGHFLQASLILTLCHSPGKGLHFSVALLRKDKGIRLLGYIEIGRGEALRSGEEKKRTYNVSSIARTYSLIITF
jgi:hypothetical protein